MTKCKKCHRSIRWTHNKKGQLLPLERDIDVEHGLFCGVDIPYYGWPGYPPISGGGGFATAPPPHKEDIMFPNATSPEALEPLPGFRCGECLFFGHAQEYVQSLEQVCIVTRCQLAGHHIQKLRIACQLYQGPGRCPECLSPVPTSPTRPRIYCSDACKMKAYRDRKKETQLETQD